MKFNSKRAVTIFSLYLGMNSLTAAQTSQLQDRAEAVLVWPRMQGTSAIQISEKRQGKWSQVTEISSGLGVDVTPTVTVDHNNRLWVLWSVAESQGQFLYFATRQNNQWQEPVRFDTGFDANTAPTIVTDNDGQIWVAWAALVDGQDDIFISNWNGLQWSTPTRVNDENEVPDILPQLELGPDGSVTVSWSTLVTDHYELASKTWRKGAALEQGSRQKNRLKAMNAQIAPNAINSIGDIPEKARNFVPKGGIYIDGSTSGQSYSIKIQNGIMSMGN